MIKIKKGFMMRKIQKTAVVVPFGEDSVDFNNIMNLNETGTFIWSRLEGGAEEDDVVRAMTSVYDVDEAVARNDFNEFVTLLRQNDLLEEC